MVEKEYDDHKCFVFSAAGYEEITYSELCRRCNEDKSYESKQFIPLHGMLLEVAPEQYKEFYKEQRRQKYLVEQSIENKDVSIDALTIGNLHIADFLADSVMDIAAIAERHILLEQLCEAIRNLTEEEQHLIHRYYYYEQSETELAKIYGISQQAVSKRLQKVLEKLRKSMGE